MKIKKILKNKYIKIVLSFLGLIYIKPNENDFIKNIKSNFSYSERSFYYKRMKYLVDSIYCHAAPGTIENILLKLNTYEKNSSILNLGGGSGQVSSIYESLGFSVTNVDIELEVENDKNINFDLNSNENLPLHNNSFDVIMCQEIIEHVENPWRLLRLAKKHLKPSGTLFLTTPNIQSIKSRKLFLKKGYFKWFSPEALSYHINAIPLWEIQLICDKLNFEITEISGNGEYYFNKTRSKKDILSNNETLIFTIKNK